MTINSEVRAAGPFEGNDVATSFPFEFKVFADSEVLVVRELDGVELARLMVENNLGVSVKQVYEVKQLDSDYFAGE